MVDFAPDGRAIVVEIQTANASGPIEFAWLSLADQSFRSIRTFERWAAPANHHLEPEVSPDGRFLAFAAAPAPDTQDLYLYVMDAEGRAIEPVVSTSGRRGWPKWTADGRHLLFTEERGNNDAGLWSVAVENGRAAGQPKLVYGNIGGDSALLGITKAGVLHYRRNDVGRGRYAGNVAHVVPRTRAAAGSPQPPMTFQGCCAAWSPDGQRLAYHGSGDGVVVRRVETGEERSYGVPGTTSSLVSHPWFHDGSAVLVVGANETEVGSLENNDNLNLHRIELGSGAVRPVLSVGPLRSWRAALSKDDRTLYVAKRDAPKGPFTQIVAVDIATGTERRVAALPAGITFDPEIVVSPDTTTLAVGAVVGQVWQSDGRIYTVKVDGTDFRDVGGGGLPGFWGGNPLRWVPDGRSLLFRAFDTDGDWQIMRIPARGGAVEPESVSYATVAPLVPEIRMVRSNFNGLDVSPDGSRVVVSTLVAPKFEVWAIDLPPLAR
jgi:Tol biopolymer transport system component